MDVAVNKSLPIRWSVQREPTLLAVEGILSALLVARKAGTVGEWLRAHPRMAAWIRHRLLAPVIGVASHALGRDPVQADAVGLVLVWAVASQRPDRAIGFDGIAREAWIDRTSWRPMLAQACQFGFVEVPDFRDRYRRHPDETAASNLCGLWAIGPSTFYRYLDKGRRSAAMVIREQALGGGRSMELRALAQQFADKCMAFESEETRRDWHRQAAADALTAADFGAALWHRVSASDSGGFTLALQRHSVELANEPDTDALIERMAAQRLTPREAFDLRLACAALWRARGEPEREREALEHALRIGESAADKLMLGIAHGALGKFHEPRDADRAFACYQDSAELLWQAGVQTDRNTPADVLEAYLATLVKLAWLHVLRNDPSSKAILDRAEQLRAVRELSAETAAMLEQVWGEYWRRTGELKRAIEHKHRALNLYERLDDRQAILKTCSNLSLIYGQARDFDRAIEYSRRVLDLAGQINVEPEIVASTHLNLGVTHFWQGAYADAIREYQLALEIGLRGGLRLVVRRAHYNLAEAYYIVFKQSRNAEDERRGDIHAAAALEAWPHESDPAHIEATRGLKSEILGPGEDRAYDRLMPQEYVAHYAEMIQVQNQRAALAVPGSPDGHVRAHLAIANAYLAIAVREREAALALIERHGLGDRFQADFDTLRTTFDRQLTREQRIAGHWRSGAADLLGDDRSGTVLAHLQRAGSINKSTYAALCAVALATASKHLVTLAERGLLVQSGRGPSTRYTLPTE
jgi:tetratricopeptide (TPR) repeat protein